MRRSLRWRRVTRRGGTGTGQFDVANQRAALPGNDGTARIASHADVAGCARLSARAVLLLRRAEPSPAMSWGSAVGKAGGTAKGKLLPNVASGWPH
ncbi:hypothetical protein R70211_05338 [Paraburkholderia domus]|uniref:Uncharacterized protein n=1 Tax=Paraburkholderia domus TaxID=2793075 RepID=A0A9N8R187_9BURK|nr:hypothetical protein R70211_05338 [Paraburkholderia domus]